MSMRLMTYLPPDIVLELRRARQLRHVVRHQNTVITKTCIECSRTFEQKRYLKGICSEECKKIRRTRFRPPTFKTCDYCGDSFGPVNRLSARYCGVECKNDAARKG